MDRMDSGRSVHPLSLTVLPPTRLALRDRDSWMELAHGAETGCRGMCSVLCVRFCFSK